MEILYVRIRSMQGTTCFGCSGFPRRKRQEDSLTFEKAFDLALQFETIESESRISGRALHNASMCTADIYATDTERHTRPYFQP